MRRYVMDKFDYDSIHKSIQEAIELQNKSSLKTDRKIAETNKGLDKLKELYVLRYTSYFS